MLHIGLARQDPLVKLMDQYFPDVSKRPNLKILDLAAGTGLVGEKLNGLGFTNIDAVDGSEPMLKILENKQVYKRHWQAFLGMTTDPVDQVDDESYDVVIISGGLGPGHVKIQVLRQAARALKKNGIFINIMTEHYIRDVLHLRGLEPLLSQMEKEGVWKVLLRMVTEVTRPGLYHVCRKLV